MIAFGVYVEICVYVCVRFHFNHRRERVSKWRRETTIFGVLYGMRARELTQFLHLIGDAAIV